MKFRSRRLAPLCRYALILLAATLLLGPRTAHAQGMSAQDIQRQIETLEAQGITPDQIRQQLQSMGVDPTSLDSYLNGSVPQGEATPGATRAIRALSDPAPLPSGSANAGRDDSVTMEAMLPDSSALEREVGLRVFGLRTFARATSEFEPLPMGPVGEDYLLGPGDELVLILTGDVEAEYVLPVTRDGFIVIPRAGQIWVNGVTLGQLRDRLYDILGRVYSGIGRERGATTQFDLTLGQLRSNQLFLTGEVRRPGSYRTSPLASVLNALYQGGGPQPTGSFRDVRILRNGEIVQRIDLYGYLTSGSTASTEPLQSGDVIFVPVAGTKVAVKGAVTRPAIYELRDGETLADLLDFAGGLTAPASLGRAQITRVVPAWDRTEAGVGRAIVDVDLTAMVRGETAPPRLYDGDVLTVYRVRPEVRQLVSIEGAVWKSCELPVEEPTREQLQQQQLDSLRSEIWELRLRSEIRELRDSAYLARPGSEGDVRPQDRLEDRESGDDLEADQDRNWRDAAERGSQPASCSFHFTPGMRAWDAIEAAEGLRPDAYRTRAHIVRVDQSSASLEILPFSLERGPDGEPLENPRLEEFDAIRIFARSEFNDSLAVRVSGEVRRPGQGEVPYRQGMTLGDLLLAVGGLSPEADLSIEVSRRPDPEERRQGQLARTIQVQADSSYIVSETGIRFYPGENNGVVGGGPGAADFELRPHDHVFVRRVPNLAEAGRTVRIEGEVTYPGRYALQSKDERLSQFLGRTGGLSATAFEEGFRLYRHGELVNVELPAALRHPGSENDLILLPGDSMVVPEYNPVVVVQGAVNSPAAVLYREGAPLSYYIANAGGYTREADRDQVNIRYANGEGKTPGKVLFFRTAPKPGPGSFVSVPTVPSSERTDATRTLTTLSQVAASLTTLLLVLSRF